MRVKRNIHRILIAMEKSLVKRPPDTRVKQYGYTSAIGAILKSLGIITWLLCFFTALFYRFISGIDRFILSFDRFIPASMSPYNSKCTSVSKMCIVLYFVIISFQFLNKHFIRTNIFLNWKIQLTPIQGFPRLISMPQAVDCDPQAVTGVSRVLWTSCRRSLLK